VDSVWEMIGATVRLKLRRRKVVGVGQRWDGGDNIQSLEASVLVTVVGGVLGLLLPPFWAAVVLISGGDKGGVRGCVLAKVGYS